MEFFPGDGHGPARLQVFDPPRNFLVPSFFDRRNGTLKAIEQRIGQGSALIAGERKCAFQEIGSLWTHGLILPRAPNFFLHPLRRGSPLLAIASKIVVETKRQTAAALADNRVLRTET